MDLKIESFVVFVYVFRSLQNMLQVLKYMSWMSFLKYSSEIFVALEFHNLNLTCEDQMQGKTFVLQTPASELRLPFHKPHHYHVFSTIHIITMKMNNINNNKNQKSIDSDNILTVCPLSGVHVGHRIYNT